MEEKFYIACQSAEEQSSGIVSLTDEEYKAVKKFLKQVHSFSAGYCGSCGIDEKGYSSEEEALKALYEEDEEEYYSQDELSVQWHSMGRSE